MPPGRRGNQRMRHTDPLTLGYQRPTGYQILHGRSAGDRHQLKTGSGAHSGLWQAAPGTQAAEALPPGPRTGCQQVPPPEARSRSATFAPPPAPARAPARAAGFPASHRTAAGTSVAPRVGEGIVTAAAASHPGRAAPPRSAALAGPRSLSSLAAEPDLPASRNRMRCPRAGEPRTQAPRPMQHQATAHHQRR
jgi:hypothetical protein